MKRFAALAAFAIFGAGVFALNHIYQYCWDDFIYALDASGHYYSSIGDVWIENLRNNYRPVVHFFVRLFCGLLADRKILFDIANTAAALLSAALLCRVALRKWRFPAAKAALALALYFLLVLDGGSTMWCAGSVNYLWTTVATLAMCIVLERFEKESFTWPQTLAVGAVALFAGWMQDASALPFLFALGLWHVRRIGELDAKRITVWSLYAIGVGLLVYGSLGRASHIGFSVEGKIKDLVKIALSVKAVWLMFAVMLWKRRGIKGFVRRNEFELFAVAGSILMIVAIGYVGDHSLWAAHLFATVVVVREVELPGWAGGAVFCAMTAVMVRAVFLQAEIQKEFSAMTARYMASPEGFTFHRRVNAGWLGRYVYQVLYHWQDYCQHTAFITCMGRADVPLRSLPEGLYRDFIESDTFCTAETRLPVEREAYARADSNAIVVPLAEGDATPKECKVEYNLPKGLANHLRLMWLNNRNPRAPFETQPETVTVRGRRYALVPCYPTRIDYITSITLH